MKWDSKFFFLGQLLNFLRWNSDALSNIFRSREFVFVVSSASALSGTLKEMIYTQMAVNFTKPEPRHKQNGSKYARADVFPWKLMEGPAQQAVTGTMSV